MLWLAVAHADGHKQAAVFGDPGSSSTIPAGKSFVDRSPGPRSARIVLGDTEITVTWVVRHGFFEASVQARSRGSP